MNHPPETKTASAPARTPATKTRNDGAGHTMFCPSKQGGFVASQEAAEDAARQLIFSWSEHGVTADSSLPPDRFPNRELAEIADAVLEGLDHGIMGWTEILGSVFADAPEPIRAEFVGCCEGFLPPSPKHCGPLVEKLQTFHIERRKREVADRIRQSIERGDEIDEHLAELAELEKGCGSTSLASQLAARAFDFDSHPAKPVPIFTLCEMPLCTPGNVANIQAPPKAGKSGVMEAMIAAVFNGNRIGPDTLGFSAENPQGRALIHLDTEQSRFDHDALIRRACRRAQVERPPSWFRSYSVADLDICERRQALRFVMDGASEEHGGIFAVMIDGIGDLCGDPNDSEESFALVHELHSLAIRHDCTVVTVLHENPGSEFGKTRGHLGSQLERKAETNLRLAKDKDGITTIWAERARHCYLPKEQGPCFSWSDQARMHTSCGTSGEIKSAANRERMQAEAETVFSDAESFRHGELVTTIMESLDLKEKSGKERVRKWHAEGIITKDANGKYHLSTP